MLVGTEATTIAESDHWGMAACVERVRRGLFRHFDDPVAARAKRGQKEAAEEHLLEERRHGDAEGEHHPRGSGGADHFLNGRVGRAGHDDLIEDGQGEAGRCCGQKQPEAGKRHLAAPFEAVEEAFVPYHRKDNEAEAKGKDVENALSGNVEAEVGGGFR